jgi:hypothetical protein
MEGKLHENGVLFFLELNFQQFVVLFGENMMQIA